MTSTGYIADGWNRNDGYVAAAPLSDGGDRIYDSLSFSYRPATRPEMIKLDAEQQAADKSPKAAIAWEMIGCEFVAKHVLSWDLKDHGGHAVKVSGDSVLNMNVSLFNKLYLIIRCAINSDAKPGKETIIKRATAIKAELADLEQQLEDATEKDNVPPTDQEQLGNSQAASG
jgi:hypothetical protein